jgi:5-methylcytosine-specific restriction endonuclease McrA
VQRHRTRDEQQEWRRWYKTADWQRLRWQVLKDAMFTCQMAGCGRIYGDTSQLVADHKIQHHGKKAAFWDKANLQCLCKPCHDKLKQREEKAKWKR